MKLLILGATGRTGQQLVAQALEQHHEVTAFVRDPSKLELQHEKLTVVKGDVLDKDVLMKALEGKDAVVSALGRGMSLKSNNLITNAMNILVPAMNATGVKRLIFESGFGVGETNRQASFIQKMIFGTFLRNLYADKARGEAVLRKSSLDWTLVYPVRLINGPRTGKYKAGEQFSMKGQPTICRADVADFMLRQLTDNTYLKKLPVLTT
ncbi:MAG: SDR family oxidoreductase [Ferruginibacter sp.]|nr:SDR family oxidoreductase [Chitinophagaceae bacterium]MBP6285566.1 SDR family oxidoreductase [Ferruginibacter sp.]MBU9935432.1 SDR family oxidoreductase [Ferruginibacter sp.]HQY12841.1 SDR family oxidoreductase [Ferruginibacter sp.]